MEAAISPHDLSVVIPTRDRWSILARTLEHLEEQTVQGFETIVVVDGTDQNLPHLPGSRVIVKEHGGPGAARNAGVEASDRRLVLLLGDDIFPEPDLVVRHLERHARHPEDHVAVLGQVRWHPEVARGRIPRWLDWSGSQFDFENMDGTDAGWGRFYSSNLSMKRRFFVDVGGFDERFTLASYEDTELGLRLHDKGLRLLHEPNAVGWHHHRYDWPSLERRFRNNAMGEFVMVRKHPEFAPFFLRRVLRAKEARHGVRRASPWPWLVDRVPAGTNRLRRRAEERADAWYYDRLGEAFFEGWAAAEDLADLQAYLGTAFDWSLLRGHHAAVEAERLLSPDEESFYRSSQAYLYDLTAFAMTSTKAPYLTDLRRFLTPGARVLDYGCGIGADGLRLIRGGADVSFADFDNPSTAFLRWRLERRGLHSPVYDIDDHVPGGFDAAFSFDVIEHVDEPLAFLAALEERAGIVAVNFLEPDPDDTDLHRPLPVPELLDHADDLGILRYRRYHRRSHLVIYRSPSGPSVSALASHVQRRLGRVLPGSPNWSPVPQP